MKNYIQFLSLAALSIFAFACSNPEGTVSEDSQKGQAQEQEVNDIEIPLNDFRNARWGMSKQEVMDSERTTLVFEEDNSVEYRVFVGNYQAQANYKFQNDKLVRAGLYFVNEYEDKNEYIKVYDFVKEKMIEDKGSPIIDKQVQLDPSQDIDPEQIGQAVCDGKVIYGTQWKDPRSDIQLLLRGEEGTCYVTVIFLKNIPEGSEDENKPEKVKTEETAEEEKTEGN